MSNEHKLLSAALRYHRQGNLNSAERAYRKLLRRVPDHADGLHGLGLIAHQRGHSKRALELLGKAIARAPGSLRQRYNFGVVLNAIGKCNSAIAVLSAAVEQFSHRLESGEDLARTHTFLSELNLSENRLEDALRHARKATQLQPANPCNQKILGAVFLRMGRLEAGTKHLVQAIRLKPDDSEALNLLGRVFHDSGDLHKAGNCYARGAAVKPDSTESYCNLGRLYLDTGLPEPAQANLRKALHADPDNAEAYVNLAVAMLDKHDYQRAYAYYQRGCRIKPNDGNLRGYWAHALLLRGMYSAGWEENERGLSFRTRVVTEASLPYWKGENLQGHSLLILAEQGIGDEVMYVSCLRDLLEKAKPDSCLLECDARLIPLFKRSFPGIRFKEREKAMCADPEAFTADVKIPVGSLPRFYRNKADEFPERSGYLTPDRARVELWRRRYKALGTGRVIGIAWRGGHLPQQRKQRSTDLLAWAPILSTADSIFVNLQYGDCRQALSALEAAHAIPIHDWPDSDPLINLDDYAARIAALDLVISIDNSTAHMAGAIGTPAWTLLPFVPEWRWMRRRQDTPWYPGMRLFRQPQPGDWTSVMGRVASMLTTIPPK